MPTRHNLLSWAAIGLQVGSWILLLLLSITGTPATKLSLANVIVDDGEQEHIANFGAVTYRADARIIPPDSSGGSWGTGGYDGRIGLWMEADPHPFGDEWPEGWPNGQARLSSQPVLWRQDTATFVLFPISLGIVSLAVALFGFGLVKRRGAYQAVSALASVAAMGMTWTAWYYTLGLPSTMDERLDYYRMDSRSVWSVRTEPGNAIWLGLVGAILLTLSVVLIVTAMFIRPPDHRTNPDVRQESDEEQTEMRSTKSRDAEREIIRGSQNTLV